jgi:hypothetical protein
MTKNIGKRRRETEELTLDKLNNTRKVELTL